MAFEWSDRLFNTTADSTTNPEAEKTEEMMLEAKAKNGKEVPAWVREHLKSGKLGPEDVQNIIAGIEKDPAMELYHQLRFTISDLENLPATAARKLGKSVPKEEIEQVKGDLTEYVDDFVQALENYYRDVLAFEKTKRALFESADEMKSARYQADLHRRVAHDGLVRALADLYRYCYGPFPNPSIKSLRDLGVDLKLEENFFQRKTINAAWDEVRNKEAVRPNAANIAEWAKTAVAGNNLENLIGALTESLVEDQPKKKRGGSN